MWRWWSLLRWPAHWLASPAALAAPCLGPPRIEPSTAAAARAPRPPPTPAAAPAPRDERQAERRARARRAESTRPLRIELQQIETRLDRLGTERTQVEAALSGPAAQGQAAADFAELGRRLAHIGAEVQALEERWLELHAALESLDVDTGNGQP